MFVFPYVVGFLLEWLLNLFNNYFIALIAVTILLKIATMLLDAIGAKMSSKYTKLIPQVDAIKNSGGDVHQVEAELTELYKQNNIKTINFLAKPLATFINLCLITGFIKALFSPLTYMLRFPKEILTTLSTACGTGSQMAMLALFNSDSGVFASVLNSDYFQKLETMSHQMIVGGWDLSVIPTVKYLFWLPVIALTIRVVQIVMSAVYSYLMYKKFGGDVKKIKRGLIVNLITFAMFSTLVFAVPAGLSVYYITSSILNIFVSTFNFIKNMNPKTVEGDTIAISSVDNNL